MKGKKLLAGLMVTGVLAMPVAGFAASSDSAALENADQDAAGIPVVISVEPDEDETASASAVPISVETPVLTQVTLADLTEVAEYLAGKTELTQEQLELYDLNGSGTVTLTDLTQLAAVYAEEMNDGQTGLPEADPAYATQRLFAEVVAVDAEAGIVTIRETSPDAVDDLEAIVSDETIIIDCQTGEKKDVTDLTEGDRIDAYISAAVMPSLPPKASCYAIITNLPEDMGFANYVRATSVTRPEATGNVVVLNQNADVYVTIPSDLEIEVFGEDTTASPDEIQDGTRLIVWYDIVLETYPAQATALRCMIVPEQTEPAPSESPEPSENPEPSQSAEPSGSAETSESTEPTDSAEPSDSTEPSASPEVSDGNAGAAEPSPTPVEA